MWANPTRFRPAVFAVGLMVPAVPGATAIPLPAPLPVAASVAEAASEPLPTSSCLATTLCALKDEVRWRTPAWSERTCATVADAVLSAANKYRLSPALILAVMLNESDLDEKATVPYYREGDVYARDGGLMGIRCVFGNPGRCDNGHVKGLAFRAVMDPVKNVELGARALAYFRDQGGVEKQVVRERGPDGRFIKRTRKVRCRHRNHAWWAHYNHGSFYISRGHARHYPQRVAVLYHGFARALGVPAPELASHRITVADPGRRSRTGDRPVETRYRVLYDKIGRVGAACAPPVTALR